MMNFRITWRAAAIMCAAFVGAAVFGALLDMPYAGVPLVFGTLVYLSRE